MEGAESIWLPLGELLLQKGLVGEDELELALTEQAETGRLLGAILVERGSVSGAALAVALAQQYGVELKSENGFGTGLRAELDRRHRSTRSDDSADNVVKLEPAPPRVEVVPDLEPDRELEGLAAENRRLRDEIERLRGAFTKLELVELPRFAATHLLFVPTPAGYVLVEREGRPPEPGAEVEVREAGARFVVSKVDRSSFPDEPPPCAFLNPLA